MISPAQFISLHSIACSREMQRGVKFSGTTVVYEIIANSVEWRMANVFLRGNLFSSIKKREALDALCRRK
jgi:hypothetical protein